MFTHYLDMKAQVQLGTKWFDPCGWAQFTNMDSDLTCMIGERKALLHNIRKNLFAFMTATKKHKAQVKFWENKLL